MMGSRIREARKLARLTQEQLAEKAELNRVTVAVLGSLRTMLAQLHDEERALAGEVEVLRAQVTRGQEVDGALLREHLRSVALLLPELEPEELRTVYRDLFELRFDLQARAGAVHMKLQGPRPKPVGPEVVEEFSANVLRSTSGRSAPTIRCPEILAFWMPGRGHQVRCLSLTA